MVRFCVDQLVENVVVQKELLLEADVLERQAVVRVEIGVGAGVHNSLTGPGLVHSALHVDGFGFDSGFRGLELIGLSHIFFFIGSEVLYQDRCSDGAGATVGDGLVQLSAVQLNQELWSLQPVI